jgi:hypothetical protein
MPLTRTIAHRERQVLFRGREHAQEAEARGEHEHVVGALSKISCAFGASDGSDGPNTERSTVKLKRVGNESGGDAQARFAILGSRDLKAQRDEQHGERPTTHQYFLAMGLCCSK